MIDLDRFVAPLSSTDPSGPNLEYSPEFQALERAYHGQPEQVIGNSVKPGEDPNWPDVRERAEALLGRARDLRIVMPLLMALVRTEGFAGLADGLSIVHGLLEKQWDTVHPQLDAEDNNDPTSRVNSLMGLVTPDGVLKALRETTLVVSRKVGRFTWRDYGIASGKQPAPAGVTDPPQMALIDAAFRDADLAALQTTAETVTSALEQVRAIDGILEDHAPAQAPDFEPLTDELEAMEEALAEKLAARGVGSAAAPGNAAAAGGEAATSGRISGGGDAVTSRADVVRQLDRVCEYYRQHEPSSPIPLLLQRAKRLVSKDFLEIIRDLTPSGVSEAESLRGIGEKSE